MRNGDDELHLIRVELDHLVSVRYEAGLTGEQLRRYEHLLARELELLSGDRICA